MALSKSPYVSECMVFQGPSGVRTSGSVSSLKLNAADAECMLAKEWSSIMLRQFLQTDRKRKRDFTGSLSKTSQTTLEFVSCIVFDRLNWTPTPPASKSYFRVKVLLCFCSLGQWSNNLNIKKKKLLWSSESSCLTKKRYRGGQSKNYTYLNPNLVMFHRMNKSRFLIKGGMKNNYPKSTLFSKSLKKRKEILTINQLSPPLFIYLFIGQFI